MKRTFIHSVIIAITCNIFLNFSVLATEANVVFSRESIIIHTVKGDKNYNIEIAKSNEQLEQGLMYRKSLPENEGMLFLFNNNQQINMWMKNTLIPLDMLFIDNTGKIIYIARDTAPNSLTVINAGNQPVSAVLELGGGVAKAHDINIGDNVDYKAFK